MEFAGHKSWGSGVAAWLVAALVAVACHEENASPPLPATPAELRSRAESWFESVDLYKPVAVEGTLTDVYQAPMFYRERPSAQVSLDAELEFGALRLRAGELALDAQRPTVYTVRSELEWAGATYSQLAFLWFRRGLSGQGPTLQGIRVTRDSAGFPAVVEVLEDSSGLPLVYVSGPVEKLAEQAFGAPFKGRLYSVESEPTEEPESAAGPELLVVHLFSQGAQPLGPILYDAFSSADVIDLHCRCASSRIKTIEGSVEYELRPLASLPSGVQQALLDDMGWSAGQPAPGFLPTESTFSQLRLPPLF